MRVGPFRKAAKVPYPQPYAAFENATSAAVEAAPSGAAKDLAMTQYQFNCAQRAHGNFLENYPLFMPALLIAGLRWPVASSVLGMIWNVGRTVYAVGYTSKSGKNGNQRLYGTVQYIGFLGLLGMLGKMGFDMVMA